jgi:TRAP transporter 4TM/12TM fusion protein
VLAGLSLLGPAFVLVFSLDLVGLKGNWIVEPPVTAFILGLLTWALVLEGVRRATDPILAIIIGLFSVYPLFASFMPAPFMAKSYSINRLVGYYYLGLDGMMGLPMQTFGSILIGFLVFGVVMEVTGAAKFLLNIALSLVGRTTGGPALVSVLASSFLAMLSGSSVANVISVGTITIPTMKKLGYPAHVAAAIESNASTGGVLMPPVMGATAFLMAAILRLSYAEVCIAAFCPMVVYYVSLFAQVFFYSHRHKLRGMDLAEVPPFKKTFKEGWFYIGAIAVLIYLLFYVKVEVWAPFYASAFLVVCAFFRKETRPNLEMFFKFSRSMGQTLTDMAPTMAGIGILIGALGLTGVGQSIAGDLSVLAGHNLYLLLVFGAIAALILGMGMPITAVYIFTALTFAPALIDLGVPPIVAHLFFLYWGMLSFITPPVCISVYAAAALAGAPIMKTGITAMRLGVVLFIIPFVFVLNPVLAAQGSPLEVIWATFTAIIGAVLIAGAIEGHMVRIGQIKITGRVLLFISGFLFLIPETICLVAGLVLAILVFLYYFFKSRTAKKNLSERGVTTQ